MNMPLPLVRPTIVLPIGTLLFLLLLGAVAVAQETTTEEPTTEQAAIDPAAARDQGEQGLSEGDVEKAMEGFTKLVQWGMQNQLTTQGQQAVWYGLTGRGRVFTQMREYDAALQEFKQVTDSNREYWPALIARGQLYLEVGANDQALIDFQNAVKANRASLDAQFGLGKASVLVGLYQQAISPLTRVIEAHPDHAEAYRLRGAANANLYKKSLAYEDLQKSIEINPDDHEAHFTLGEVLLRDKKYAAAVEQLGTAIDRYKPKPGQEDEPYLQGYLTRSLAYVELGKYAEGEAAQQAAYQGAVNEAERLLQQLDEDNPYHAAARAATLHSRGVGERMLGDLGKAVRTFSEAIELNPDQSESYYRRGICFLHLDEDKMAIADFVQAANINYTDPRANLWEGFTHAKRGDYHQAVRAYGNAIAASDRYAPAYVNRGLAYMMLGEYDKAVNDFNEAIRLEPTVADHYYKRGIAYEQLRDYEKASGSFANAIRFNDQHADAYRHMASTLQSLGRGDEASEYRQKASQLAPGQSQSQVQ